MQKIELVFPQPHPLKVVSHSSHSISAINRHVLTLLREKLKLKGYSSSTIRIYGNEMAQLLKVLGAIPADRLNEAHLKRYLLFCADKLKLKENSLHSRINALKFYYEQV